MTTDPLLDNEFLKKLFSHRYRETYARVTSLNIDEEPLEMVEGRITQGSVNLDGSSSLRRSCSLSIAANYDTSINDYYWTLNTKFKLMLGLKNEVEPKYPDIIWFKMGTYVITSFNYSYSATGMSLSMSGKDKMCLINGDVGGAIYASVDFGTREEVDVITGEKEIVDINIEDIIREAVHEYGHEPWENIIIRDIPKYGLFLLEWTADQPLYALIPTDGSDEANQVFINNSQPVQYNGNKITLDQVPYYLSTNELTLVDKHSYSVIKMDLSSEKSYQVCRILPGQSAGYDVTELTYPREKEESGLVVSVGGSVTDILDKIVSFLGNYEQFFNLDGQFIFQKKDKWIDTNWNANDFDATGMGNDYDLTSILNTTWQFEGNELITNFSNSPNIGNIKNDFAIWGERKSGDTSIPLHMRQAVDKKPVFYRSVSFTSAELTAYKKLHPDFVEMNVSEDWPSYVYCTKDCPEEYKPVGVEIREEDWRELIYQMALDYRRFNHFDTFNARVLQANTVPNKEGSFDILYPKGITGYEQYYVDLEGFWRYLYRPDYAEDVSLGYSIKTVSELDTNKSIYVKDEWVPGSGATGDNTYYAYSIYNSEQGIYVPYLVEYPKRVNVERWVNQNYGIYVRNCWESSSEWHECRSSTDFFYYPVNPLGLIGKYKGIFYDNGAEKDSIYNTNNYLINDYNSFGGFKTTKYNLLIKYTENYSLATLRSKEYIPIGSIGGDLDKFNEYTVYNTGADGYYMFDHFYGRLDGEGTHGYDDYFLLKKVEYPTVSGIKQFDSDEFVYRMCFGGNNIKCKVGILDSIPSTYTYDDFYIFIDGDNALNNKSTFYRLRGHEEQLYITTNALKWEEFKEDPFFNFGFSDDFENSAIHLNSSKEYLLLNSVSQDSRLLRLFTYNSGQYYQYYNYIKCNNYDIPLKSLSDYQSTHSPIAYYQETYSYNYDEEYSADNKWNILKNESPELLIFWFDFLDSQTSEIGKYGTNNVMDRSKASNESNVKAIYYRDTLNIIYQRTSNTDERYKKLIDYTRSGYNIMQCGDWIYDYFRVANCGKSCKDVLDQWLYQYTQANESVSISCIPIYTLEPNNRISVHDDNIKINGEYIINSISIPLTYNGTMSINATKAVDKLY